MFQLMHEGRHAIKILFLGVYLRDINMTGVTYITKCFLFKHTLNNTSVSITPFYFLPQLTNWIIVLQDKSSVHYIEFTRQFVD